MAFGGQVVEQEREGEVKRSFEFFRDRDGNPWLDITQEGKTESFAFRSDEFDAFIRAAQAI